LLRRVRGVVAGADRLRCSSTPRTTKERAGVRAEISLGNRGPAGSKCRASLAIDPSRRRKESHPASPLAAIRNGHE
jgi:hypothetical protein